MSGTRTTRRTQAATAGMWAFLASLAGAGAEAQTPYTVDDILAAPFATDLVAAPSGSVFAWVRYDRGARGIWVAEGPDFVGRQLTAWPEDDGQDLSQLRFTPDGRQIVFVRGGGPNRAGEIPNPRSEPEPANRMVWVASLDGAARPLAEGTSPAISPDGRTVAFLNRGQVYTTTLDGSAAAGPLLRIRGSAGSLAWSPDGEHLAFVSNRGDHAFVGVFALEDRAVRYLDPSLDRDGNPVWSPDGTGIAFIRIPNEGGRLPFSPVRSALPWSIRVVDLETGAGREVWRALPGSGSAFQGVSGPALTWLTSGHFVFPGSGRAGTTCIPSPSTGARRRTSRLASSRWNTCSRGPTGNPSTTRPTRGTSTGGTCGGSRPMGRARR